MIGFLRDMRDRLRGGGDYAITVSPMDGTLRPNNDLENATVLTRATSPGHLSVVQGDLWFASGCDVKRLGLDGEVETVQSFPAEITALAAARDDTVFAACADGTCEVPEGYSLDALPSPARKCITAICFGEAGAIYIAVGSTQNSARDWPKDLLERNHSGSVWRLGPDGSAERVADGLAWPSSLIIAGDDLLVSEASRARLIKIGRDGKMVPALSNLPGYPGGICAAQDGGYHLCIVAPRNQLIEFILREPEFVQEMIETTDREHWIAPSLKAPESFLEPLQGGALKQLGIMKPWAPSRSIGLVMHLNADFVPTRSHHSRADGKNHGTTSCALWHGDLIVACHGNDCLLRISREGARA